MSDGRSRSGGGSAGAGGAVSVGADTPRGGAAHRLGRIRARLLAVIATVLTIALLKWSAHATVPVAFALFVIAAAWPLQRWLERRLPRWAAFVGTILVLLALLAAFIGGLAWLTSTIAEQWPHYQREAERLASGLTGWLESVGLSVGDGGGESLWSRFLPVERAARGAVWTLTLVTLILAFTVLGLVDVPRFRRAIARGFSDSRSEAVLGAAEDVTNQFLRYVVARTIVGLINGVAAWLFLLVLGVDLALVWGAQTFLLNYIPTVGSIIAVLPPSLFALVQFDGYTMPLVVFVGLSAIQLIQGNYIDPLIQGYYLKISPFVVLFSIVFWGWVWGIPGALLGVPITVLIVIATARAERTRWIAYLLGEPPEERRRGRPAR